MAGNSASSSVAVTVQAAPPAPGGTNVASAANGGSVLGFSNQFDERALASYVVDGKQAYNAFYTAWWVKAPAASEYVTVGFDTTSLDQLRQRGQRRRLRRPHGGPVLLGRRRHLEADRHLTPASMSAPATPNDNLITFAPVLAKAVRFTVSEPNDPEWVQLCELEVFGTKVTRPPPTPRRRSSP